MRFLCILVGTLLADNVELCRDPTQLWDLVLVIAESFGQDDFFGPLDEGFSHLVDKNVDLADEAGWHQSCSLLSDPDIESFLLFGSESQETFSLALEWLVQCFLTTTRSGAATVDNVDDNAF